MKIRFDLQVVGEPDDIATCLMILAQRIVDKKIASNCSGTEYGGAGNPVEYDYGFTDCQELYVDNSECHVVHPDKM